VRKQKLAGSSSGEDVAF